MKARTKIVALVVFSVIFFFGVVGGVTDMGGGDLGDLATTGEEFFCVGVTSQSATFVSDWGLRKKVSPVPPGTFVGGTYRVETISPNYVRPGGGAIYFLVPIVEDISILERVAIKSSFASR